jgi:hypothetical protein
MADKPNGESQKPRAKSIRGLVLVVCGLWLVCACEVTPSEQFKPRLVVHGLVLAGSLQYLKVNVNRSYAIDDSFDRYFPGANGIVWRGSDTWPLQYLESDVYGMPLLRIVPEPRDTFGIRLAKDGFDTVYGQTVVPDSFRILFPRNDDTVTMADSMVWNRSRSCAGYYMSFRNDDPRDTFTYDLAFRNDTSGDNFDSAVFRFRQMVFLYLFAPGKHTLKVYALDTNYFDWVSAGGFGPGSGTGETTQLSGGLGVFGSAVGESLKVYVKTETTFSRGRIDGARGSDALPDWSFRGQARSQYTPRRFLRARNRD